MVIKLLVKVSSENRSSKQLLPTPKTAATEGAWRTFEPTAVADEQEFDEMVIVLTHTRHSDAALLSDPRIENPRQCMSQL